MKLLSLFIVMLSLVVSVEAKQSRQAQKQAAQNKAAEAQRKKEKEARDKKREAIDNILKPKDKNNDGSLTKEEYLNGEADQAAASRRFDSLNTNGDRYLTRSELEASLGH